MEQDLLREEAGVCKPSSVTDRAEMPRLRLAPRHLPTLPTKTVRALLCHHCNAMLGHADESPAVLTAGIAYLRQHAQGQGGRERSSPPFHIYATTGVGRRLVGTVSRDGYQPAPR
jgi:hypothetical protein